MVIKAIIFDLGNTLIEQKVDSDKTLDQMELKLFPAVKQVLKALSQRYRLALLTNTKQSTRKHVWLALSKLSIADYFEAIVTSFDLGAEKPDAKMFLTILSQLRVKPYQSLMVGNDFLQDIQGARKIGMRTAYFVRDDKQQDSKADLDFRSLGDLPELIRCLEANDGEMA